MQLSQLIGNGTVFQSNKPITIFGTGGGTVEIAFCGTNLQQLMVGTHWQVQLPAMDYGGPYELTVTLNGRTQHFTDIYIGDVYLMAGQSNMQFQLHESDCDSSVYHSDPLLRLFSSERPESGEFFFPQDGWVKAQQEQVGNWTCLGYLAGSMRRAHTGHAVGIITCYQGAATIQSYLPDWAFEKSASHVWFDPQIQNQYVWNEGHSQLYHSQFQKIAPFSVAGVVWYQGESNTVEGESQRYLEMLSCLIHSWRADMQDDSLPFLIVQIADCASRYTEAWKRVQQAQLDILIKEEQVFGVISRDICEDTDIHPKQKFALAERIAEVLNQHL